LYAYLSQLGKNDENPWRTLAEDKNHSNWLAPEEL
jgi:hypothetical protein